MAYKVPTIATIISEQSFSIMSKLWDNDITILEYMYIWKKYMEIMGTNQTIMGTNGTC